jgi:hypothetical protein
MSFATHVAAQAGLLALHPDQQFTRGGAAPSLLAAREPDGAASPSGTLSECAEIAR